MGNAWDTAKDGIMSEEDYPYEHKVLANQNQNQNTCQIIHSSS